MTAKSNKTSQDRFGILVRVSTDMQAQDGDSIEMQINLANEIIKEHNGILVKTYLEEGVSASKNRIPKRPKLLECINDIKNGTINHLIVYRRDRLVRNTEDSIIMRKIFKENNCKVTFSARGESPFDFDDPYSILIENVRASIDEIESIQTAMRVSDTMIDKAKRGEFTGGSLPYGYKKEGENIVPIESEIPIIEEIVDLYLKGYGVATIARYLNGEEVEKLGKRHSRAKRIPVKKRDKDYWTRDVIYGILFSPVYTGYFEYESKVSNLKIKEKSPYITPIRSEEIQEQINNVRNSKTHTSNPKKYNTPFLLRDLLTCRNCGSKFKNHTSQRKDGTRYSYYKCPSRDIVIGERCRNKSYKKELIESYIIMESKKFLKNILNSNIYNTVNKNLQNTKTKIEEQLENVESQIVKTEKDFQAVRRLILELNPSDDMYDMLRDAYLEDQKNLLKEMNRLKQTKEQLQKEMNSKEQGEIDINYIIKSAENFINNIDSVSEVEQKKLIDEIFSEIGIDENGNVDFILKFNMNWEQNEVEFISFGGVGEAMTTNNIKEKNEYTFYSHLNSYIEIVHNAIRENILKFIFYKKPTLPKSIKKFAEETGISEDTYKLYKSKMITPSHKMMMHIFDITESNEKEFTEYLNKQAKINVSSDFLMESLLFQKDVRKKYLFSRKIKCGNCNTNYLVRRKNHSHDVYYICNSINKEYCGNYKIEELTILKAINKHTNLTFDEELIKNHIDHIVVFNNGDFTVYFKEKSPYGVLNVKSKEVVAL